MKCSAAAMPAPWHVRGTLTPPALPADSFSLEIRGGNFSFQPWSHHAFVQKYFLQDPAPSHYPFPGRESTHAVDLAADSQTQSSQAFPSVHAYLGSCSDIYSVCFSRGAACNLGVSSEQVGCQIVLKTCPFHLLSGYCTQMNRGLLSLETFWSTKHSRKSTGGTNSLRHQ